MCSRAIVKMPFLYFVTCQTCFLVEKQWSIDNCPSRSTVFAHLPHKLSNPILAKVTFGQGTVITKSGLSMFLKKWQIVSRIGMSYLLGGGASFGILG